MEKQWPRSQSLVTAPMHALGEQPTADFPFDHLIHEMVGDFSRMRAYAVAGYQIAQDLPVRAVAAYDFLIGKGYTAHLLER